MTGSSVLTQSLPADQNEKRDLVLPCRLGGAQRWLLWGWIVINDRILSANPVLPGHEGNAIGASREEQSLLTVSIFLARIDWVARQVGASAL
jgi:hypothetical protein